MAQEFKKCFITVGTTRFDLLCEYIMASHTLKALKKIGCKEIIFQIGNSNVDPGNYEKEGIALLLYRFKDSIQDDILNADLVISHAGAGSCLEALEAKKPLLVVVNEDLMDNHQLELAEQLQLCTPNAEINIVAIPKKIKINQENTLTQLCVLVT